MEQTSLNIGTIGQKLETARQAKGVSVSEAGQATKILAKFIKAMEADDFGVLSAPVYARSFIKMYAQYLGLDAQPLVAEYTEQYAPKASPLPDEVRQNLTQVDQPAMESAVGAGLGGGNAGQGFAGIVEAISRLSASGGAMKLIISAAGALLMVGIIVFSVTQCAGDETEPSTAGGAAGVARELITEDVPDAYLVKPGVVEVDK